MKSKFIIEAPVVSFQKILDDEIEPVHPYDDVEDELLNEPEYTDVDDEDNNQYDDEEGDQPPDLQSTTGQQDSDDTDSDDQQEGDQDPDRQGVIRTVPDAHLIYKRKDERNLYSELWVFKQDYTIKISSKIYDAIMAGTDIPKGAARSSDGTQRVVTWEVGPPHNTLVYVEITGLSN